MREARVGARPGQQVPHLLPDPAEGIRGGGRVWKPRVLRNQPKTQPVELSKAASGVALKPLCDLT